MEREVILKDSERQPCERWSRVMGYLRPITEYNKGKQQEHLDRKLFTEPMTVPCQGEKDLSKPQESIVDDR